MYRKTRIVAKHIQRIMLAFAISLIPTAWVSVNADTSKTTTSKVTYYHYYFNDHHEQKYHGFLPDPVPEEHYYHTRMKAFANIDDTPEKETIVLIGVGTKPHRRSSNWHQAFLLITHTKGEKIEKKEVFKLFDTGAHPLNVPAAKAIELHTSPFVFAQPTNGPSFRLADVTGDGTLDVWVESHHGVALVSFENKAFKEVFSRYTVTREKLAETPDVEYHWSEFGLEFQGQMYQRFLPSLPSKKYRYETLRAAIANVDDTQEKETIVLVVAYREGIDIYDEWSQAYLLITTTEADGVPKKKDLFPLAVQNPPFVFRELTSVHSWGTRTVSFKLLDLTGDGILDVWMESHHGAVVISFQKGELKEVLSCYASIRRDDPIEYIDLDNDGIYEIKIPDLISVDGIPTAARPDWMSLYKWDGNSYVLHNERFYAENDEFLLRLLENYHFWERFSRSQEHHFHIGLVYYYRRNFPMARGYLQWVVKHAKNDDYRQAAKAFLKEIPTH